MYPMSSPPKTPLSLERSARSPRPLASFLLLFVVPLDVPVAATFDIRGEVVDEVPGSPGEAMAKTGTFEKMTVMERGLWESRLL